MLHSFGQPPSESGTAGTRLLLFQFDASLYVTGYFTSQAMATIHSPSSNAIDGTARQNAQAPISATTPATEGTSPELKGLLVLLRHKHSLLDNIPRPR